MANPITQIVILGGGSAGWLAANHLGVALQGQACQIVVVESPQIGTIGVGEGTVPQLRDSLRLFGISETDLIRHCSATYKQSIEFVDWSVSGNGQRHRYHHPFDYQGADYRQLVNSWLNQPEQSLVDFISNQGRAVDRLLAPKQMVHGDYQGPLDYAFHFDATQFAGLLQHNAIKRFGVEHISATVTEVELHPNGDINCLTLDDGRTVGGQLFVDCSGFASRLLGQALQVPFVDCSDRLLVDTALAVQLPYEQPTQPIASATIATAQTAGWIWDIGLQHRRGVGHVFSSQHQTAEQAELQLRRYLGVADQAISVRKIPMTVGYRQRFWQANCVAIGLSQGFVEPLEATALLVTDSASRMLAQTLTPSDASFDLLAQRFNEVVGGMWQRTIDFIQLHYRISQRNDSQFWQDNRHNPHISDSLLQRLTVWQQRPPCEYDFDSRLELFNQASHCYVLYGMNYPTQATPPSTAAQAMARHHQARLQRQWQQLQQLPAQRQLLNNIQKHGLAPI